MLGKYFLLRPVFHILTFSMLCIWLWCKIKHNSWNSSVILDIHEHLQFQELWLEVSTLNRGYSKLCYSSMLCLFSSSCCHTHEGAPMAGVVSSVKRMLSTTMRPWCPRPMTCGSNWNENLTPNYTRIYLFIIYLFIYLFICLFVYLFIYSLIGCAVSSYININNRAACWLNLR